MADILTLENPVFKAYLFYCTVLVLKMMAMSVLTALQRMKHRTFISPEDAAVFKGKTRIDENVERVRRAHLNDMENIPIFFVVSLAYLFTNPAVGFATLLFRIFAGARIIHTVVYVTSVPQPARAIAFFAGYLVSGYMAVNTILHFI